jgi:hypothetical protein
MFSSPQAVPILSPEYLKSYFSPSPVAHTYNPSCSGSRNQEDHSSKPAQENSLQDPILKNPISKNWASRVAQGEGPEFKPQYHTQKKKLFHCHCGELAVHVKTTYNHQPETQHNHILSHSS